MLLKTFELEEKIEKMVAAHEITFGCKPHVIDIPMPYFYVCGVRVNFHKGPQWFSADNEHCLHHDFFPPTPEESSE